MEAEKLGQVAYDGYCRNTGYLSLVSGERLPLWDALKPEIKAAWRASAVAVEAYGELVRKLAELV